MSVLRRIGAGGIAAGVLFLTLVLSCDSGPGGVSTQDRQSPGEQRSTVKGEYLVTLKKGSERAAILSCFGPLMPFAIKKAVTEKVHLVRFEHDPGIEVITNMAAQCPGITAVQPNYRYRMQ